MIKNNGLSNSSTGTKAFTQPVQTELEITKQDLKILANGEKIRTDKYYIVSYDDNAQKNIGQGMSYMEFENPIIVSNRAGTIRVQINPDEDNKIKEVWLKIQKYA